MPLDTLHYPSRHATIAECIYFVKLIVFSIFLPCEKKLFKMAQKMQSYDEMSTTKLSPLSTTGIPGLCVAFS